jgi:mRNA-degrading endonuclease YafQ of YafQ-DinJ toxin-antitoxin module
MTIKKIVRTRYFRQVFHQRIRFNPEFLDLFYQKVDLLLKNEKQKLRCHSLKGSMLTLSAFSLTKDIRVIYKEEKDYFIFLDVGTHKQVYKP